MYVDAVMTRSTPLGDLLRKHRREQGLTQQQLADQVGLSKGGIGAIETGETVEPERSTILKLARALGLDVDMIERAVRASVQRIAEPPEIYLSGDYTPEEYWQAILARHNGDVQAALRFLHEVQAKGLS